MPTLLERLKQQQGLSQPTGQQNGDLMSRLKQQAGLVPATQVDTQLLQELTPQQQARLAEIEEQKQIQRMNRQMAGFARPTQSTIPLEAAPTREEMLLARGIETGGEPLRWARMKAGFTSNPVPVIQQALYEQYPDADPSELNVRYIPIAGEDELERQMDELLSEAERATYQEIKNREREGNFLSEAEKQKLYDLRKQTALTKVPGMELVYNDPQTGRITSVNPIGLDLGDLGELAGPAIPFVLEALGAGGGAVLGAASPLPGGTVIGATAGGGVGGSLGESIRLGIGRIAGIEPEEQDYLSPVLNQGMESGMFSFLGAGLSHVLARTIAKGVANGKFGYEAARLAKFVDDATFSKNKKAVERMNEIARERGINITARATMGQLTENKTLLAMEKELRSSLSPLDDIQNEQARFLDAANTAFTPEGNIKRGKVSDLIQTIQSKIKDDFNRRKVLLGRDLELAEEKELIEQTNQLLEKNVAGDNKLGKEALRDAAKEARQRVLREKYGNELERIERLGLGFEGRPREFAQAARDELAQAQQEVVPTMSVADQKFIREAAVADTPMAVNLKFPKQIGYLNDKGEFVQEAVTKNDMKNVYGMIVTSRNLKKLKRKADANLLPERDSVIVGNLIDGVEQDIKNTLLSARRGDIYDDLVAARDGYETAIQNWDKGFAKLLQKDASGNYRVREPEFFEKVMLTPDGALGARSLMEEAGMLDAQLPMIRQGIKDVFSRKFLPRGKPEKWTDANIKAAEKWFEENKGALEQFFDKKALAEFKSPIKFANKRAQEEQALKKANDKMREWFHTDLSDVSVHRFMDAFNDNMTPARVKQLKNILPEDNFADLQALYQSDVIGHIRNMASEPGFSTEKLFARMGHGPNPTTREQTGRELMEEMAGSKFVKDITEFGDGMRVLQQTAGNVEKVAELPEEGKQILRFITKPLSTAGRRTRALLSLGLIQINKRMERAMADPESWEKMMKAIDLMKRTKGWNEATGLEATRLMYEALGPDLYRDLKQKQAAIEEN